MISSPARELVRGLVEARLSLLDKDMYRFGTIGDKPPRSSLSTSLSPIHDRIKNFVSSDAAKGAVHSAASKVFSTVKEHHKSLIASALITGVTHAAHIDIAPGDLEDHLHHQIEHLGTSLSISKDMAHHALTHAVGKLKELRGIKEAVEKDDELDAAIAKLHKILKKIEPHYRDLTKSGHTPKDRTPPTPPKNDQGK